MRGLIAIMLIVPGAVAAPIEKVPLQKLNTRPEVYLGQVVSVDGLLLKCTEGSAGKSILTIGLDARTRALNLQFNITRSIADDLQAAPAGEGANVRIIGTVVAPAKLNAPHNFEVEEVIILKTDGSPGVSYVPRTAARVDPPSPAVLPAPASTTEESLPVGTLVAGGVALLAGLGMGGFLLLRRRRRRAATPPPPPIRSVSDRLNRRVR